MRRTERACQQQGRGCSMRAFLPREADFHSGIIGLYTERTHRCARVRRTSRACVNQSTFGRSRGQRVLEFDFLPSYDPATNSFKRSGPATAVAVEAVRWE